MAEYVMKIAEEDRLEKITARTNAVFGEIMAKFEILLQLYNCSPSSSHGAANSSEEIPTLEPPLNVNLSIHDEIRSSAKQIEVAAKQISESSSLEPYFETWVTDLTKIVDDLGESILDNVQRSEEIPRADGFEVQCDSQLTVNTTGDCDSGVIATPELPNAEPITTHSVHNEDTSQFGELQGKVTDDDVVGNRGLSLQCEIPFALYSTSIVNNHASSLKPMFQLNRGNLLAEITVLPLTTSIQICLSYVRQNVSTQSPPPKPPDCAVSNPLLPLIPPNMNHLMSPPPPKPLDNVSLPKLTVLDVFPSFSTTIAAQKLFDHLPHRNKITLSQTGSMSAQHSFDTLGLVLFDGYVTKNWQVCRDGDMLNHFTSRNMPTVDSILKCIQVVVYDYSVILCKLLIGKHIHERWQQKSQGPHSQFGVIVDHDECEKATLFNIGLASKTVIIFIDLVDKIIFRGVGNDIINIVLIPCLFSNILCNENTIGDINVVEVEMMERIRHKNMLLSSWSDSLEFNHVLEAAANCFIERQKLILSGSDILTVILLEDGSFLAAQKLKSENAKDRLKVTSQTKVLLTSVLQNVTCHICCYFKFGSIVLVLFDYSANSNLEMLLPQCIRKYLKLDWYIKLVFDAATNTSAFFLYEKPLIMCHNLKYSCISSNDHFYITIARLGWLSCVVTSDLQWYMNSQSLYFSKTNIYDMCVVLLKGILGLNYLASPTLGMCKREVRQLEQSVDHPLPLCYSISEWIHIYLEHFGGKSFSAVTLLLRKGGSVLCYKLASWIKHAKNWDPGGNGYFIRLKSSLHFKQWDPGGCYLVNRECSLDFERFEKLFMSFNTIYLGFNLEDKVDFKGEGIVMSLSNWTGPNESELTLAQKNRISKHEFEIYISRKGRE